MFLIFVLTICIVSPVAKTVDRKYTALQFGTTLNDYISFSHNKSPFRTAFTLCTWIKRVYTSSSSPVVFQYLTSSNTYEILTGSNGKYNRVLNDYVLENSQSKFTTQMGQWFLYCLTWSSSSRTIQIYLDGELAASGQTSSGRALHTSGTVWLGRLGNIADSMFVFGGQLYRFNLYNEILSSGTIKRIADGGLCAEVEETIGSRTLRWEDILAKSRTGSVVEVTVCDMVPKEFIERQLKENDAKLNAMREELQTVTGRLNRTKEELDTTRVSLESVTTRSNRTEEELNTCSAELTDTKSQLKGARKFSNITMWDILYTDSFYHQIFTGQLLDDLKSWSWDLLEEFIGVNVTEGVITHLQKHDVGKAECGAQISDILNMWDEFIGVKMTRGIIQHFKENHNDDPCDD